MKLGGDVAASSRSCACSRRATDAGWKTGRTSHPCELLRLVVELMPIDSVAAPANTCTSVRDPHTWFASFILGCSCLCYGVAIWMRNQAPHQKYQANTRGSHYGLELVER